MRRRAPRRSAARSALVLAVAAVTHACGAAPAERARRHEVDIEAFRFDPESVEARPGDTVVWTNHDVVPHTVTAEDGSWSSGSIEPGATWSTVVRVVDRTPYFCAFHPPMTGELTSP